MVYTRLYETITTSRRVVVNESAIFSAVRVTIGKLENWDGAWKKAGICLIKGYQPDKGFTTYQAGYVGENQSRTFDLMIPMEFIQIEFIPAPWLVKYPILIEGDDVVIIPNLASDDGDTLVI